MNRSWLFILILILATSCMFQNRLSELKESKGNIQVSNRDFSGDFQFGDCFHYQESGKEYILIVSSVDQDGSLNLIPIAIPSSESLSDSSIGILPVNYYSTEPNFISNILGGQIPFGGFGFYVSADELPNIHGKINYLFSLNLDPDKFIEYGGTSLLANETLGYTIEFCLDFEDTSKYAPDRTIMLRLPLENLCKLTSQLTT